jgi:hypothetical protein
MLARLEQELASIERCSAGVEAAVSAEDWESAARQNAELTAGLERINSLLEHSELRASRSTLQSVAGRLGQVLDDHEHRVRRIRCARESTANEIERARTGRRAASHYLDTAGH